MTTPMHTLARWPVLLALALFVAPAVAQQAFPTPEAAAQALVDALGTQRADGAKLAALFGKNWQQYVPAGDVDRSDVDAFLAGYKARHSFAKDEAGRSVLAVGEASWTFPVPLVQGASGWTFDTQAGAKVIRERRIGRNELAAIESARAYNDAQNDYALNDHDGDGVLEYAQKILSTDGRHDGLYWSDDDSGDISPLGPLFADAAAGSDWHGYHFRILTAQGPSAPGGAYPYKIGDNMSRGFALVAWPAKYNDSGVMSFMISHDGEVFEKDLGPQGATIAQAMKTFDPDSSWKEVPDTTTAGR